MAEASTSGITRSPRSCGSLAFAGFRPADCRKGARVGKATSLDLVRRVFRRDQPNQLWMADITEHPTREGKVYCAVVLDAYSRMIVGWSIDTTQTTRLVTNALGMATQRRGLHEGLVLHSDRGVQPEFKGSSQHLDGRSCDGKTSCSQNSLALEHGFSRGGNSRLSRPLQNPSGV